MQANHDPKSPAAILRRALLSLVIGVPMTALAAPPASSPYATDAQESYVQDETGEAIGTVNMIMCFMSSMRPDQMINEGDYVAMIDRNRCESRSSQEDGAAPDYLRAVVNSSRSGESDPMTARVWLENREGDQEFDIYVRTQLTEGASASMPYGAFRLEFGAQPLPGQGNPLMQGFLQAAADGISFVERGYWSGVPEVTQLSLQSAGGDAGSGALRYPVWGTSSSRTVTFGFNATHFRRSDGTNDRCFSRSLAQAKTSVWRYGLYDEVTGARLDRNSGFPFRATIDGREVHGYIGYHGLSARPDDLAGLVSGSTITREERDGAGADYTLVRSGGKLVRHTQRRRALAEADGLRFETWADAAWPGLPPALANQNVAMSWDESNQRFVVLAKMECGGSGCNFVDLQTPVGIDGATMAAAVPYGVSGHAPQLNGQVHIPAAAMTDSGQTFSYRASRVVAPGEMAAGTQLHCISDCPNGFEMSKLESGLATDPFGPTAFRNEPVAPGAVVSYEVDAGGAVTLGGVPVVYAGSPDSLDGSSYRWGIQSGRMVTDLGVLECSPGAGQYCAFRADEQSVYYTWETGPNPWNGYAGARDAQGNLVSFEQPMRVTWLVPDDAGSYGEYAGKSLVLQYSGFGDLHGLPSYCVDPATNAEVPCGTNNARWVPELTIPLDATDGLVTVEGGSERYLVKWLDREVRFAQVAAAECNGIALGDVASLPDTASLVNPSDPASDAYIGPKPAVSAAPSVIDGELQD